MVTRRRGRRCRALAGLHRDELLRVRDARRRLIDHAVEPPAHRARPSSSCSPASSNASARAPRPRSFTVWADQDLGGGRPGALTRAPIVRRRSRRCHPSICSTSPGVEAAPGISSPSSQTASVDAQAHRIARRRVRRTVAKNPSPAVSDLATVGSGSSSERMTCVMPFREVAPCCGRRAAAARSVEPTMSVNSDRREHAVGLDMAANTGEEFLDLLRPAVRCRRPSMTCSAAAPLAPASTPGIRAARYRASSIFTSRSPTRFISCAGATAPLAATSTDVGLGVLLRGRAERRLRG